STLWPASFSAVRIFSEQTLSPVNETFVNFVVGQVSSFAMPSSPARAFCHSAASPFTFSMTCRVFAALQVAPVALASAARQVAPAALTFVVLLSGHSAHSEDSPARASWSERAAATRPGMRKVFLMAIPDRD